MYSWGTNTTDWKDPDAYSYDSARKPYLDKLASDADKKTGARTYMLRSSPDNALVGTKNKIIRTESKNPIIVGIDVTGSMASWPAEIFDRLPLLYQTLSQYKDDLEISFGAIGDAFCDSYPLQVNHFGKGLDLEDHIKALCPEGGGGGQISETYELFAYFMDRHCETPNATSPFLFIFGDEKFYNTVDPSQVEYYIGDKLQDKISSKDVFGNLLQKFNLYFLHKPYGHGGDSSTDKQVIKHWADVIGQQRIIELPSAERAVDIAMGIVAKHWGEYTDFSKNLGARQPDKKTQHSVHATLRILDKADTDKSVFVDTSRKTKKTDKTKTKSLTEMFNEAKDA